MAIDVCYRAALPGQPVVKHLPTYHWASVLQTESKTSKFTQICNFGVDKEYFKKGWEPLALTLSYLPVH